MVIKRIWPLLAVFVVAGCTGPTDAQRKQLDALVGKTEVDVIRAYGVPTRTFQTNGHIFLAYIDNQTSYSSGGMGWGWGGWGGGPGWGGGWGGYGGGWGGGWGGGGMGMGMMGGGFPSSYYNTVCQTTFELAGGAVTGWTMRGDGC
ncbi:hypothetical protein [Acetobacter fallax]|uniref:Lipoprotein n=1 Tax=Acetobacter fallax TaxID=1737473 RepID=A0ABX0K607_9PROT|nr:hypothetical protein [Acetobacter fallax]NHO31253.1 hypothetical protein [Acetobacter fallax]NHO34810.1 hypothetical protein [Acetobacter fallax]